MSTLQSPARIDNPGSRMSATSFQIRLPHELAPPPTTVAQPRSLCHPLASTFAESAAPLAPFQLSTPAYFPAPPLPTHNLNEHQQAAASLVLPKTTNCRSICCLLPHPSAPSSQRIPSHPIMRQCPYGSAIPIPGPRPSAPATAPASRLRCSPHITASIDRSTPSDVLVPSFTSPLYRQPF